MSSTTQTALAVTQVGQPLTKISRPIPQPGPGELLVKVTVAGLNPHDAKSRSWGLFVAEILPTPLAIDVVGVVTAVGGSAAPPEAGSSEDVDGFKTGDRVFSQSFVPNPDSMGLQEYAILPTAASTKIPEGFSDAQAVTLTTNLVTSAVALFDPTALGIPAPWISSSSDFDYGSTALLIYGGGSNTGKYAVQLASLAGIGTIIVVASPTNTTTLKSMGATHIIDRHLPSSQIISQIRSLTSNSLLYAYDTINPPSAQLLALDALSTTHTGTLARLLPRGGPDLDASHLSTAKQAGYVLKDVFGSSLASSVLVPHTFFTRWLPRYLQEGGIKPIINEGNEVIKGLDVDAVNKVLDGYDVGAVTGQVQVHLT